METYKAVFREGNEFYIAFVNDPAMEGMFVALNKEEEVVTLKTVDAEKRIVAGLVLEPNKLIPRVHPETGEKYNIFFDEKTVEDICYAFTKNKNNGNANIEHRETEKIEGVTFVENWIVRDEKNDTSIALGLNAKKGSWVSVNKIDNDEVWNDYIKTGKVKGFSFEGMCGFEKVNLKSELNMSEQKSAFDNIVDAIKEGFASIGLAKEKEVVKLGSIMTQDGVTKFNFEGDTIKAGETVLTMTDSEGAELPVPDGDYTLEDGATVTVSGSIVQEVVAPNAEEVETETEMEKVPVVETQNAPVVKSEKVTSEVFYQLSKEELNTLIVEFGNQVESKISELRSELETKLSKEVEAVQLTKQKPAKETSHPNSALERFRASKL